MSVLGFFPIVIAFLAICTITIAFLALICIAGTVADRMATRISCIVDQMIDHANERYRMAGAATFTPLDSPAPDSYTYNAAWAEFKKGKDLPENVLSLFPELRAQQDYRTKLRNGEIDRSGNPIATTPAAADTAASTPAEKPAMGMCLKCETCDRSVEVRREKSTKFYKPELIPEGGRDAFATYVKNYHQLRDLDRKAVAAGTIIGRYISEPVADGTPAFYQIVDAKENQVSIVLCLGLGNDCRVEHWDDGCWIDKQYAIQRLRQRDALTKISHSWRANQSGSTTPA